MVARTSKKLFILSLIFLLLKIVPNASAGFDCQGKTFYCTNTTHFLICVNFGNSITRTFDDFVLPCPEGTECWQSNDSVCEIPAIEPKAQQINKGFLNKPTTVPLSGLTTKSHLNIFSTSAPVTGSFLSEGTPNGFQNKDSIYSEPNQQTTVAERTTTSIPTAVPVTDDNKIFSNFESTTHSILSDTINPNQFLVQDNLTNKINSIEISTVSSPNFKPTEVNNKVFGDTGDHTNLEKVSTDISRTSVDSIQSLVTATNLTDFIGSTSSYNPIIHRHLLDQDLQNNNSVLANIFLQQNVNNETTVPSILELNFTKIADTGKVTKSYSEVNNVSVIIEKDNVQVTTANSIFSNAFDAVINNNISQKPSLNIMSSNSKPVFQSTAKEMTDYSLITTSINKPFKEDVIKETHTSTAEPFDTVTKVTEIPFLHFDSTVQTDTLNHDWSKETGSFSTTRSERTPNGFQNKDLIYSEPNQRTTVAGKTTASVPTAVPVTKDTKIFSNFESTTQSILSDTINPNQFLLSDNFTKNNNTIEISTLSSLNFKPTEVTNNVLGDIRYRDLERGMQNNNSISVNVYLQQNENNDTTVPSKPGLNFTKTANTEKLKTSYSEVHNVSVIIQKQNVTNTYFIARIDQLPTLNIISNNSKPVFQSNTKEITDYSLITTINKPVKEDVTKQAHTSSAEPFDTVTKITEIPFLHSDRTVQTETPNHDWFTKTYPNTLTYKIGKTDHTNFTRVNNTINPFKNESILSTTIAVRADQEFPTVKIDNTFYGSNDSRTNNGSLAQSSTEKLLSHYMNLESEIFQNASSTSIISNERSINSAANFSSKTIPAKTSRNNIRSDARFSSTIEIPNDKVTFALLISTSQEFLNATLETNSIDLQRNITTSQTEKILTKPLIERSAVDNSITNITETENDETTNTTNMLNSQSDRQFKNNKTTSTLANYKENYSKHANIIESVPNRVYATSNNEDVSQYQETGSDLLAITYTGPTHVTNINFESENTIQENVVFDIGINQTNTKITETTNTSNMQSSQPTTGILDEFDDLTSLRSHKYELTSKPIFTLASKGPIFNISNIAQIDSNVNVASSDLNIHKDPGETKTNLTSIRAQFEMLDAPSEKLNATFPFMTKSAYDTINTATPLESNDNDLLVTTTTENYYNSLFISFIATSKNSETQIDLLPKSNLVPTVSTPITAKNLNKSYSDLDNLLNTPTESFNVAKLTTTLATEDFVGTTTTDSINYLTESYQPQMSSSSKSESATTVLHNQQSSFSPINNQLTKSDNFIGKYFNTIDIQETTTENPRTTANFFDSTNTEIPVISNANDFIVTTQTDNSHHNLKVSFIATTKIFEPLIGPLPKSDLVTKILNPTANVNYYNKSLDSDKLLNIKTSIISNLTLISDTGPRLSMSPPDKIDYPTTNNLPNTVSKEFTDYPLKAVGEVLFLAAPDLNISFGHSTSHASPDEVTNIANSLHNSHRKIVVSNTLTDMNYDQSIFNQSSILSNNLNTIIEKTTKNPSQTSPIATSGISLNSKSASTKSSTTTKSNDSTNRVVPLISYSDQISAFGTSTPDIITQSAPDSINKTILKSFVENIKVNKSQNSDLESILANSSMDINPQAFNLDKMTEKPLLATVTDKLRLNNTFNKSSDTVRISTNSETVSDASISALNAFTPALDFNHNFKDSTLSHTFVENINVTSQNNDLKTLVTPLSIYINLRPSHSNKVTERALATVTGLNKKIGKSSSTAEMFTGDSKTISKNPGAAIPVNLKTAKWNVFTKITPLPPIANVNDFILTTSSDSNNLQESFTATTKRYETQISLSPKSNSETIPNVFFDVVTPRTILDQTAVGADVPISSLDVFASSPDSNSNFRGSTISQTFVDNTSRNEDPVVLVTKPTIEINLQPFNLNTVTEKTHKTATATVALNKKIYKSSNANDFTLTTISDNQNLQESFTATTKIYKTQIGLSPESNLVQATVSTPPEYYKQSSDLDRLLNTKTNSLNVDKPSNIYDQLQIKDKSEVLSSAGPESYNNFINSPAFQFENNPQSYVTEQTFKLAMAKSSESSDFRHQSSNINIQRDVIQENNNVEFSNMPTSATTHTLEMSRFRSFKAWSGVTEASIFSNIDRATDNVFNAATTPSQDNLSVKSAIKLKEKQLSDDTNTQATVSRKLSISKPVTKVSSSLINKGHTIDNIQINKNRTQLISNTTSSANITENNDVLYFTENTTGIEGGNVLKPKKTNIKTQRFVKLTSTPYIENISSELSKINITTERTDSPALVDIITAALSDAAQINNPDKIESTTATGVTKSGIDSFVRKPTTKLVTLTTADTGSNKENFVATPDIDNVILASATANTNNNIGNLVPTPSLNKKKERENDVVKVSNFVCKTEGNFIDLSATDVYYRCSRNSSGFLRFKYKCGKGFYLDKKSVKCLPIEFNCTSEGRFSDDFIINVYYICIKKTIGPFVRLKYKCQNNYYLDTTKVQCIIKQFHETQLPSPSTEEFKCPTDGRFANPNDDNTYYVCAKRAGNHITRFKFKCQEGLLLDKVHVRCIVPQQTTKLYLLENPSSASSTSEEVTTTTTESNSNKFVCTEEGKFPKPGDCRRYFECDKKRSGFRRKRKRCDNHKVFDKTRQRCVDSDKYSCD